MGDKAVVPDNVWQFLGDASSLHGKSQAASFLYEMHSQLIDTPIKSPIEQLFYVAFHAMAVSTGNEVNPEFRYDDKGTPYLWNGVYIAAQHKVGSYRVDFLVSQIGIAPEHACGPVVVELDGHQFHDKNKQQRSYEKARDRFLVKEGYRVVHYTGSDIVNDPYSAAWEVLEMLGAYVGSGRYQYDPADPMGLNDA